MASPHTKTTQQVAVSVSRRSLTKIEAICWERRTNRSAFIRELVDKAMDEIELAS